MNRFAADGERYRRVIRGDSESAAIAAAPIIAKTTRDPGGRGIDGRLTSPKTHHASSTKDSPRIKLLDVDSRGWEEFQRNHGSALDAGLTQSPHSA